MIIPLSLALLIAGWIIHWFFPSQRFMADVYALILAALCGLPIIIGAMKELGGGRAGLSLLVSLAIIGAVGIGAEQHEVLDTLGPPGGVCHSDRPRVLAGVQVELLDPNALDHSFEIEHLCIERHRWRIALGKTKPATVVSHKHATSPEMLIV